MKSELVVRNGQRRWCVDLRALRRLTGVLLAEELGLNSWCLGVHLIGPATMARLNVHWLGHAGSTDVLTFDHRDRSDEPMHGELFISVEDAVRQAEEFHTTPSCELVRYIVHGVLHLQGYDDTQPAARRLMKREEDRCVHRLKTRHGLPETLVRPRTSKAERRPASKKHGRGRT